MTAIYDESGSFRDRNGQVFYQGTSVYRVISETAYRHWRALQEKSFFQELLQEGKLISTEEVSPENPGAPSWGQWTALLRHERIPFVSYPYEWCFGMLQDAALQQLEILEMALTEDMVLKDASAFNSQWFGARPIFIDIPSLEALSPGEPWAGYRQFSQMFLYPLMLQAYKGVPFQSWLRGAIDGIPPTQMKALISVRDLLRRGIIPHVYLQAKLQARHGGSRRDVKRELQQAGFRKELIQANVGRLKHLIQRLRWEPSDSEWSDYTRIHNYGEEEFTQKTSFVRGGVQKSAPQLVWDLGANTGTFSRIAAEKGAYVVAMDADQLAVERLYRALREERSTRILPLLVNIADPSPNLGWRGRERKDLPTRGKPDLVLALALVHHLVIGANIPLSEVIDWLAELEADLVIEFVTKEDPMVQQLLQNKQDLYADYDLTTFERWLERPFEIEARTTLASGTRILYHARYHGSTGPSVQGEAP